MPMFRLKPMIYDTLASYYDALVKDEEATLSWVHWIESFQKPCSMLELACGSAEITQVLSHHGFQMTALDLSQGMIDQAKRKDKEQKIQFLCQDMRDLSNLPSFESVACLCDSFNYILEKEEIVSFFKEVHDHLQPEGIFFFDTHSLDRLDEFSEEFNETGHIEDVDYQWSITSEEEIIYQDFAFYKENGEVIQEHHMQRVYDPEWLKEVLHPYFYIESIKTDFDLEGIQPGEKYFFVCRRK